MVRRVGIVAGVVAAAFCAGLFVGESRGLQAQTKNRIFEVRTYTAADGKLDAVVKRFRDPEKALFEKYGMPAVFYSTAAEAPRSENTFVYMLAHESRESARKSWAGFIADPAFRAAAAESDKDGRAVIKVESIFVNPTDFSPLK
jgi:hypothetical protein